MLFAAHAENLGSHAVVDVLYRVYSVLTVKCAQENSAGELNIQERLD